MKQHYRLDVSPVPRSLGHDRVGGEPQDSFDPCLARRCSARTIVDAAADGTLTADRITDLIAEAARAQSIATCTGELRQRTERLFVGAFFEALQYGAADELLDSLRPPFDPAAEAIAQARDLIPVERPAERFLSDAKPAALTAWQSPKCLEQVVSADTQNTVQRFASDQGKRQASAFQGAPLASAHRRSARMCSLSPNASESRMITGFADVLTRI